MGIKARTFLFSPPLILQSSSAALFIRSVALEGDDNAFLIIITHAHFILVVTRAEKLPSITQQDVVTVDQ